MSSMAPDRQVDSQCAGEPRGTSGRRARRILVVTGNLGGGTGNHLLDIASHWDRSLWRLVVVSQRRPAARRSDEVDVVVLSKPRWYERAFLVHIRNLLFLNRYVSEYEPDVVHTFFFWPIIYGRLLRLFGRISALVENREDEGFSWRRHDYALLRLTSSWADRIVCVSEAVRGVVLRRESVDRRNTVVIHNGVERLERAESDVSRTKSELGVGADDLIVGMVANMNRAVKGVAYFLDMIPLVLEAVPGARFLMLGRGKLEAMLQARAAELGVEARVIFAGYKVDIDRYYAVMDVSVLTSLSEGLSITVLESMRHGLPVVVTNVGGNPEIVVDGESGFLVPPRDVRVLADRVVKLLKDPVLRQRLGSAGRRRVERDFAIANIAAAYLRIYDELISRGEAGGIASARRPTSVSA